MLTGFGDSLYRTTNILAAIILAIVVAAFLYSAINGDAYLQIVALLVAGLIWLTGRLCKLVLTGR